VVSVEDHSRTSTITTTMAGDSSCSRTSTTPTTATRTILATRTTHTATRIHPTMLLNTADHLPVVRVRNRRPFATAALWAPLSDRIDEYVNAVASVRRVES
jgi:hypothetical protein